MECAGRGHRVGALGSENRRGQGELREEMVSDWTSKDGQNLNRWSGIFLPNIVIRSVGPLFEGSWWESLCLELPPAPAAPAYREFSFFSSGSRTVAAP